MPTYGGFPCVSSLGLQQFSHKFSAIKVFNIISWLFRHWYIFSRRRSCVYFEKKIWFDVKCFANFKAFCKKNISLHSLILMKFNENFPSKSNLKDSKQEFIKSPKIQYKDYIYFWQEIFIFDRIKIDPFSPGRFDRIFFPNKMIHQNKVNCFRRSWDIF